MVTNRKKLELIKNALIVDSQLQVGFVAQIADTYSADVFSS